MHKTIKKVTEDTERMKFNTAIAALMALTNDIYKLGRINKAEFKTFLTLLNPTAPHITEELWSAAGFEGQISGQKWPSYDEAKTIDDEIEIVVQICGKVKSRLMIPAGMDKAEMEEFAKTNEQIKALTEGKNVVKIIAVPGKLLNIVVK